MAKNEKPEPAADEPAPSLDVQLLANAISKGIADASTATGPIPQVPITKYAPVTPWNPKGLQDYQRPQMTREYLQNGQLIELWHVSDSDIQKLNQLQPGIYLDRRVEVVEMASETGQKHVVNIRYNNATQEQRFELKNLFRSFSELLSLILREQEELATA